MIASSSARFRFHHSHCNEPKSWVAARHRSDVGFATPSRNSRVFLARAQMNTTQVPSSLGRRSLFGTLPKQFLSRVFADNHPSLARLRVGSGRQDSHPDTQPTGCCSANDVIYTVNGY